MVRSEKILFIVAAVIFAGLFSFLVKVESPSPTFGSGSLNVPVYVNGQDANQATTTIFAFPGVLHTIVVTKPVVGSVINVYDSATTTVSTAPIASITIPTSPTSTPFFLEFDINVFNGLTVSQTVGTSTINLSYQQN